MDNCIKVRTDKKYAIFTLNKDNIVIDMKNEPEIGKICLRLQHQNKQIVIPMRVYDAYDMKNAYIENDGDRIVILSCSRKTRAKLQPLTTETNVDPSTSAVTSETIKTSHFGRFSLSNEWTDQDVTVYMGMGKQKRLFIERGAKKSVPSIKELKAEYGESLYSYPYDTVAYTTHIVKRSASIVFPAIFLRTWGIENGDKVKYQVLESGIICIAPLDKTDAFTGENLDHTKDSVDEVHVCEDCNESTDIKELILLMRNTMELCKEIRITSNNLTARVEALEKKQ